MAFNCQPYIIIKNILSRERCELLADYACFKANLKPNIKRDDPLAGTHREYADPLMEMLLAKFTPIIEKATGLDLWPTLSFYYTYRHGHQLAAHKDRSSCEIVASLCIGADETFKKSQQQWPLILDNQGKAEPIYLNFGDLVIIKGHETTHWRQPFTGDWFVSAIFAYVDKHGPFCFQKYDQRNSLGQPHIGMFRWTYGCLKNKLKKKFISNKI